MILNLWPKIKKKYFGRPQIQLMFFSFFFKQINVEILQSFHYFAPFLGITVAVSCQTYNICVQLVPLIDYVWFGQFWWNSPFWIKPCSSELLTSISKRKSVYTKCVFLSFNFRMFLLRSELLQNSRIEQLFISKF